MMRKETLTVGVTERGQNMNNDVFRQTEVVVVISSKIRRVVNVKMAGRNIKESAIISPSLKPPGTRAEMNVELKKEIWLR